MIRAIAWGLLASLLFGSAKRHVEKREAKS